MATIRSIGFFSLPNLPIGNVDDFLRGASRCLQPSAAFNTTTLDGTPITIEPANLVESKYTEVSLSRAMLWMWRIKSFTVTGSVQVFDDTSNETFTINIGPFQAQNLKFDFLSNPIESEKEKTCDCGLFYGEEESSGWSEFEYQSHRISVSIADLPTAWVNYPSLPRTRASGIEQRVRTNGSLYYIPVYVEIEVRVSDGVTECSSGSNWLDEDNGVGNISWSISDNIGTLTKAFRFVNNSTFLNGNISIDATEYWTYDPDDGGGPIYNSTTGQKIRFDV